MRPLSSLIISILWLSSFTNTYSQSPTAYYKLSADRSSESYDTPVQKPSYVGGNEALTNYMNDHLNYPSFEKRHDIEGVVLLKYYIMEDGTLEDVTVARSVSPGLDEEAVRLVKNMPKWHPAMQNGKPKRVKYMLPIIFTLTF